MISKLFAHLIERDTRAYILAHTQARFENGLRARIFDIFVFKDAGTRPARV